jgi:acetylornithine/N-succinyldiaminopimelate aminotransferase
MNAALKPVASPHVMNTYGRLPVAMSHGRGCRLWDTNGKEYLDALGGIAVNTLGHGHPKLVPALQDQIAKLIHSSNYYHVPDQEKLAQMLVERSGMTNVFFCSTGLEANEAALKLARKYGHDKGIERPEIVVYEKAFHGRSIATLSATGNPKVQAGFGPLVEGFIRVPLNDIEALKKATVGNPNVVAVFFETIQGEGGVNPMRAQYLKDVRALCDANDWLLMIDEVQCGMGPHRQVVRPPMGRRGARRDAAGPRAWARACRSVRWWPAPRPPTSSSPATTAPPSAATRWPCAPGVETIRIMEEDGLLENAARVGAHLRAALDKSLAGKPGVKEIRGQGLMIGIELDQPCGVLTQRAADAGLLLSVTADSVIRLVPPLIMTTAEADEVVGILLPLIHAFLAE